MVVMPHLMGTTQQQVTPSVASVAQLQMQQQHWLRTGVPDFFLSRDFHSSSSSGGNILLNWFMGFISFRKAFSSSSSEDDSASSFLAGFSSLFSPSPSAAGTSFYSS